MKPDRRSVDVEAVRARHPLPDVMAAAGVELQQRGHGYMACCPFHEDKTPSLSVDGVPDRFHCFGCGASGDVIDFVQRTRHLDFLSAVAELDGDGASLRAALPERPRLQVVTPISAEITSSRAFAINQLAWDHFATPVGVSFASHYLQNRRGIDLTALARDFPAQRFVGHATHGWATLTDRLRSLGVEDDELLSMDLSMRTRSGRLIDTYRNRLIFPVTDDRGAIHGFVGRDISGHPAAAKYRNPTHTPVFDKSQMLYRPTTQTLDPDAEVLVVEGAVDALAVAASAASIGMTHRVAVCAPNGIAASPAHVRQVLALTNRPPRIAFDADEAGEQGTARWLLSASVELHAPLLVTRMPSGLDPADWLAARGPNGLRDLLGRPGDVLAGEAPQTVGPGREVIRLLLDRADDPIRDAVSTVASLAAKLPSAERAQLLRDASAEMTRHGWNPRDTFSKALECAMRESTASRVSALHQGPTPSLI